MMEINNSLRGVITIIRFSDTIGLSQKRTICGFQHGKMSGMVKLLNSNLKLLVLPLPTSLFPQFVNYSQFITL